MAGTESITHPFPHAASSLRLTPPQVIAKNIQPGGCLTTLKTICIVLSPIRPPLGNGRERGRGEGRSVRGRLEDRKIKLCGQLFPAFLVIVQMRQKRESSLWTRRGSLLCHVTNGANKTKDTSENNTVILFAPQPKEGGTSVPEIRHARKVGGNAASRPGGQWAKA